MNWILKNIVRNINPVITTGFILIAGFFFLQPNLCISQSYLVHTYNENDGLPSSTVYDIAQDSLGRMWFATRNGVTAYDGFEWKIFPVQDALLTASCFKIRVDEKGIIWILADASELRVAFLKTENQDSVRWVPITPPNITEPIGKPSAFHVSYQKNALHILIGTRDSGLYQYYNSRWKHISKKQGLLNNRINGIARQKDKFYIATDDGLSILENNQIDNSLNANLKLPSKGIHGIEIEPPKNDSTTTERIWLIGKNWIGYLAEQKVHIISRKVKPSLNTKKHYLILQPDHRGGLYFGNIYSLYYIRGSSGRIKKFVRQSGILSEGITAIFIDRESNLWLSCNRGVSKIPSRRFENYQKDNGLYKDEVTAILENEPGKLVFGHINGLTFYDGINFETLILKKSKYISDANSRILDLAIDSEENIWVATSTLGLIKVDKNKKKHWFNTKSSDASFFCSVFIDQFQRTWVSDYAKLYQFKDEKFHPIELGGLPETSIRRLTRGPSGALCLATITEGVYIGRDGKWQQYRNSIEKNANNVFSIYTDKDNKIWVGTLAGLFTINNNRLERFGSNGFMIQRPIYLIVEDQHQRLWFGTDNGVIRWDRTQSDSVSWREYSMAQGFVGQETNRAAGILDSQGRIWLGADLGVSCYHRELDDEIKDIPPPIIQFSHLKVLRKKYELNQTIELKYHQNDLIFHFQAMSFIDEKLLKIKIQLEGYDADWVNFKKQYNPEIRYPNLSPGHYRFHIKVQNALGVWSPVKSSSLIIIQKPFWTTIWFYLLIIGFTLSLFIFIYKLRVSMLKKEKTAQQAISKKMIDIIENERERIAVELHDSVGQNLLIIRHRIHLILGILKGQPPLTTDLDDISQLALDSIDEVRQIAYDLHPHQLERLGLKRALESMFKKFAQSSKITVSHHITNINNLLPKELAIHIFRITQEGLNNVLKHASATAVTIRIETANEHLNIVIIDNGIGFDAKADQTEPKKNQGLGLNGIGERVKILRGNLTINSKLNQGTTLKIELPI